MSEPEVTSDAEPVSEARAAKKKDRGTAAATILNKFEALIDKEVSLPLLEINVPLREGVKLIVNPNIQQGDIDRWFKQAGKRKGQELDFLKYASTVVAATTEAFELDGEELTDPVSGATLTFYSDYIKEKLGTPNVIPDTVCEFVGSDAHVMDIGRAILLHAGFVGDGELEVDERLDPFDE